MGISDRPALARWVLETELFGPTASPDEEEVVARSQGLSANEAQELREYLTRPLRQRHRLFRARADRLAELYGEARRALAATDRRPIEVRRDKDLDRWASIERAHRRSLQADEPGLGEERIAILPAAISDLVIAVDHLVCLEFPALDVLPWIRDWLIRVARQADEFAQRGGDPDKWSIMRNGLVISALPVVLHQPEIRLEDATGLGFGVVSVDRSWSKEVTRKQLRAAILASMKAEPVRVVSIGETEILAVESLIEDVLRVEYPAGRRPYSLEPHAQVHRDVSLWARVRMDGERPTDIAMESYLRTDSDTLFCVRDSGSRPRVPETKRGINEAVARAAKLLRAAE